LRSQGSSSGRLTRDCLRTGRKYSCLSNTNEGGFDNQTASTYRLGRRRPAGPAVTGAVRLRLHNSACLVHSDAAARHQALSNRGCRRDARTIAGMAQRQPVAPGAAICRSGEASDPRTQPVSSHQSCRCGGTLNRACASCARSGSLPQRISTRRAGAGDPGMTRTCDLRFRNLLCILIMQQLSRFVLQWCCV